MDGTARQSGSPEPVRPLQATVVISTRNRKDELRVALASCLTQTAKPEIIVLSDGSTDGTAEMVRAEFPTVTLYDYPTSSGPAGRRNHGVRTAAGDVIITLDDDIEFISPTTLEHTLREFDDPRIGAVTIPFINVRGDQSIAHQRAPDSNAVYLTDAFVACACALRRDVMLSAGLFRPCTIMYGEEEDLSIRMLDNGFFIRLGSADPLNHYASPRRSTKRMDVLGARNKILFSWFNIPLPYLLFHLPGSIFRRISFGFRAGAPLNALQGLAWGLGAAARYFFLRAPVRRTTYRLFRLLRRRQALPLDELPQGWRHRRDWSGGRAVATDSPTP